MSASATAGQNVEPGPEGSRPISQTPGQGSARLATLYAILGIPLALLGASLLLFPGLAAGAAMADGSLKGVAAKIAAATPEGRMYDTQLRLLGIALLGAALLLFLLQKAARAGKLGHTPYIRCNTALAVWSILTLGILAASVTIFSAPTLMLLSIIATATLVVTLPQVLSTDLPSSADRTATEMVTRQTRRGRIYATLAVAFALEGVGVILTPGFTLRGAFGMDGGPQGRALWQLIGASAHVIIPVVLLVLAAASDKGSLGAQLNVWLNALVGATAGVHVLTLLRHGLFGPVGALGPPVLLAWASALGTALYNTPSRVHAKD